jgi:hypothetical protein
VESPDWGVNSDLPRDIHIPYHDPLWRRDPRRVSSSRIVHAHRLVNNCVEEFDRGQVRATELARLRFSEHRRQTLP